MCSRCRDSRWLRPTTLVEGNEETGGLLVVPDLDALGILRVIEQRNRLAHEPDGRFVEPAVEGDGAILVYLSYLFDRLPLCRSAADREALLPYRLSSSSYAEN
jgi:hypothetical protein